MRGKGKVGKKGGLFHNFNTIQTKNGSLAEKCEEKEGWEKVY